MDTGPVRPGGSTAGRSALAWITLAGAALRIALAWGRPRLGDEVGTLLSLRMDVGYLLTHFSGWLTMNYFILAEKGVARLGGSEGWPLEILPMLGGIATIPLTASLARRLGGGRLALTAAALTAFNPYLVRFSPVLRAYAPLAALAVWAVDLFFRWRERRTWRAGLAAAGVILGLLLMHPNGIYVVMGLGVLMAAEASGRLRRAENRDARLAYLAGLRTLLVPLAGAGLATWLAYRGLTAEVQNFSVKWSAPPPTSLEYVPGVFATYFGSGFLLFVPGGLLVAGVWSATQARKNLLPLCVLVGLSPVFVSLKGVSHFPWAYARFQIYCVPLMLILMAEGIGWLTARARHPAAAWALTAVTVLCWLPPLADLFAGKRENAAYARTAAYLLAQRRPGDLIVIEGASFLQMIPLLPQGRGRAGPRGRFREKAGRPGRGWAGALRRAGRAAARHPGDAARFRQITGGGLRRTGRRRAAPACATTSPAWPTAASIRAWAMITDCSRCWTRASPPPANGSSSLNSAGRKPPVSAPCPSRCAPAPPARPRAPGRTRSRSRKTRNGCVHAGRYERFSRNIRSP